MLRCSCSVKIMKLWQGIAWLGFQSILCLILTLLLKVTGHWQQGFPICAQVFLSVMKAFSQCPKPWGSPVNHVGWDRIPIRQCGTRQYSKSHCNQRGYDFSLHHGINITHVNVTAWYELLSLHCDWKHISTCGFLRCSSLGSVSIWRCNLASIRFPIMWIRWSHEHLIHIMEIPIAGKKGLYIETGTSWCNDAIGYFRSWSALVQELLCYCLIASGTRFRWRLINENHHIRNKNCGYHLIY